MSYQLSRMRLANIGDRAARFPDITIAASAPRTAAGVPLDTILWLRNGGGKSSLLSLFFALVLPLRRDFLGLPHKRYIEDYVATGDTGHTSAEWLDVHPDALFTGAGHRLVTGAVYEWDERRKPVNPERNRDKLKVNYYAFTATPGVLTLDTLPLTDDAGRPVDRATFLRRLRELAAEHPQQLQLVVTDAPNAWMGVLSDRHLDPLLFRYQKRMSHSEAAVAELFDFDTPADFIDLLIDLTVDPAQPERVAGNLSEVADIIAARPRRELEARFCETLADRLDTLAAEHAAQEATAVEAAAASGRAGALADALDGAAAAHVTRQRTLTRSFGDLETKQGDAERERLRTRAVANELVLRAEQFRVGTAAAALAGRSIAEGDARRAVAAWEATEPLATQADAREQVAAIRVQQAAAERRTAPLRERHDATAVALRVRYQTLEDGERARAGQRAAAAADAGQRAVALRARQREADAERAGERAHRDGVDRLLAELAADLAAAVAAGDLPSADTDPSVHADRVAADLADATAELDEVRVARRARLTERDQLSERRREAAVARSGHAAEHATLTAERRKLAARAAVLTGHHRLHELLQLDDDVPVDLWADPGGLRAALARAAADADTAVVAARVDTAEDDRALDALAATGYLPTTRDAQRVADALTSGGVLARPGWELLRDVVDTDARAAALRAPNLAALAAGVVVVDTDLDAARRLLAAPDLTAVAHVPVATATDLEAAVSGVPVPWAVTAPTPALFDPAAADADRTDRERHRTVRDTEIAGWSAQGRADRDLIADLDQLLTDCPAGHLESLADDIAAAEAGMAALDEELGVLARRAEKLEAAEEVDATTEQRLTGQLTEQAGRLARLRPLTAKVAARPGLLTAHDRHTDRITELDGVIAELDAQAGAAESDRGTASTDAAEHRATADRYATDAAGVRLLGDTPAAAADASGPVSDDDPAPLSTLLSRHQQAVREWMAAAAESVLEERLLTQTERDAAAGRRLAAFSADVLEHAARLLRSADGQDEQRREAALSRVRAHLEAAHGDVVRAEQELRAAQEAVRAAEGVRERDRRAAELDTKPVDEAHARVLAAQYAAASTAASEQATALGRELDAARQAAVEAERDAGLFAQQVIRLRDAIRQAAPVSAPTAEDGPAAAAEPFGGDPAAAEEEVAAAVAELATVGENARSAARRVERAVNAVRKATLEFGGIEDPIKERLTSDEPASLAALAGARATDLRARRQQILGMIADIERDQELVVTQIAVLVNDVLATLAAAQRHSRLPGSVATLGEWANEQFLTIKFTKPASEEDLRVRIGGVLDAVVREGSKPEGLPLLKRCVHAAVAPRGFKVTVLKPNSGLAADPLDISLLGKYSGGEKLTVCVALYCTLARLRAVNRGRGHAGGTLLLDNPLATASHVQLLRLQRAVAEAHGVHLVYTTGVEDLGAVGQFPNVVRLRNSPGKLRQRRYVTVDDDGGSDADADAEESGITGVRVARVDGATT